MIRQLLTPYDYQYDIIDGVQGAFANGYRRVLAVAPTGSGKTVIFSHIARITANDRKRVLILGHRIELLEQCGDKLYSNYVDFGYINPKYTPNPNELVQVGSMQTVLKRMATLNFYPDLIIVDEAHLILSKTYKAIINYFKDARVLGVTATPIRSDGKPLGDIFEYMVQGPQLHELIERGKLVRPRTFGGGLDIDFSDVDILSSGDFNQLQLAAKVDTNSITGNAVKEYGKKTPGMAASAFCVNVVHSKRVAAEFRLGGWNWAHVDGTMSYKERKRIFHAVETGELHGFSSIDIATTGLDLPALRVGIMLRKTEALSLYLQMAGRLLRTHPGKDEAYILDHVGLTGRHGFVTDPREWDLFKIQEPVKRGRKRMVNPLPRNNNYSYRKCPKCDALHKPSPRCPDCHYEYGADMIPKSKDGELVELTAGLMDKQAKAREISQAKTLEDFKTIELKRGYKDGWALHAFKAMNKKLQWN